MIYTNDENCYGCSFSPPLVFLFSLNFCLVSSPELRRRRLKDGVYLRTTMRILGRPAQNWNQEFTFNGGLAEISGVQNRGIPLFLFFPPVHPCLFASVSRVYSARALARACLRTRSERGRGKQGERGSPRSQQYIIIKLTAIPTMPVLFIRAVSVHPHTYPFSIDDPAFATAN